MTPALLRASLLAIVAPVLGCGGRTADLGSSVANGAGGSGGTGGGGGAGGGGAGTSGSGGAPAKTPFPCTSPMPILVAGIDTGYDVCASGQTQRRAIVACPSLLPRATTCMGSAGGGQCAKDSDCTMSPNGHCDSESGFGGPPGCLCQYGCTTDADCSAGSICECADPIGHCVVAKCTSNAACAEGPCSTYESSPGCPSQTFACQAAGDSCGGDKDCGGSPKQCTVSNTTETRVCAGPMCAVGRPLSIADVARVSTLVLRRDWV